MARKTGLGRGFDALIPGGDRPASSGVDTIPIDRISPNPRQPRTRFDKDELGELAASIRKHGIIQPLILTRASQANEYILVAGERRLLAARLAGLTHVPALVREANEQQRLELALIENVQRSDLSPLEAADAYRQLVEEFGLSHEEVADRLGKSRVVITNRIRLLNLSPAVKEALSNDEISEGHARALLALTTPQAQSAALQTVVDKGLNVRQTEELVRRLSGEKIQPPPKPEPLPEIRAIEDRLRSQLGTKVDLNRRKKGGTLVIHFYSEEELDALVGKLVGDLD